jgi:hypothetical protein
MFIPFDQDKRKKKKQRKEWIAKKILARKLKSDPC